MSFMEIYNYKKISLLPKRQVDMQIRAKCTMLFTAIVCLFCFQLFPESRAAVGDMSSQRKIEEQTVETSETQPGEPKEDVVLAIPGLVLKLGPGYGCAENVDEFPIPTLKGGYFLSIIDIARHLTFKIHEICLGNPKGPDIKHDFKWFMISGVPIKNPRAGCQLPPGLVLSLHPTGIKQPDLRPTEIYNNSDVVRYPQGGIVIGQDDNQLRWLETTGRCIVDWGLIEMLPKFTIFGLQNHRTQESKSFKWQEKVYNCADPDQTAPPGFRRVFLYDYCWFEKTTGPDILPESF
jgi:hypothetical protein